MEKTLVKNGNSLALLVNKEMLMHMGVTDQAIEVVPFQDGYLMRKPRKSANFDTAVAESLAQYESAFKELAK